MPKLLILFAVAAVASVTSLPVPSRSVHATQRAVPTTIDPQMKQVLDAFSALQPKPIEKLSPKEARLQPGLEDAVNALLTKKNGGTPVPPEVVATVDDSTIPGPAGELPIRVYTPAGTGPFPILIYFHGGGWVIGSVDAADASCRAMANQAKCVVISVAYRLAPEFKFPAPDEDCYQATQFIIKDASQFNGDPKRVAVGGESAGANMATTVCLFARDRVGFMPNYQLLVYPLTDCRLSAFPSVAKFATAKPLDRAMLPWFFSYELKWPQDGNSEYFSVLRNPSLKGLPPATIITAQIDPLHDEGKLYADRLRASGVPVRYHDYAGVTHGFFGMGAVLNKARDAEAFAAQGLQTAFNTRPVTSSH